jgi:DNA polymerase-3 subunit gamma/tau
MPAHAIHTLKPMSYQVLARKWRPKSFAEMAGQEHVLRALIHALDQQRLHQAYLFTGTRGVGKTTIARIVAKALNCERGVSSKPCGQCSACQEIDQGRFIDLIEVDAASRTKVEDTRELLDNVQYSPTRGRFKVYLIDEVHMLSTHSFNALLKTLEEPPPHVKFLLATTDPQKLPATILSRCLQFNLKRMSPELIEQQIKKILAQESVQHDALSLRYLSQAADGSMRDALSLLDQGIAYCQGKLQGVEIAQMLGFIEREPVYELLDALIAADTSRVLTGVAKLDEHAPDYQTVLDDLITVLQQLALAQWDEKAIDGQLEDKAILTAFAKRLSAEDIQLFYQIALIGKRDLQLSPSARRGFEMIMLRMLAFQPANANAVAVSASTPKSPIATGAAAPAAEPQAAPQAPPRASAEVPAVEKASPSPVQAGTDVANMPWKDLLARLNLKGREAELAGNCEIKAWQDNNLILVLSEQRAQLYSPAPEERLARALSEYAGRPVKLKIEIGITATETPAQSVAREAEERRQAAVKSIQEDSLVRALKEKFGAEVVTDSVRPNS